MRPTRFAQPSLPERPLGSRHLLLWFLLSVVLTVACVPEAGAAPRRRALHALRTQVSSSYGADGTAAAVVDVSLPWASLVFTRQGDVFEAALLVSVVAERGGQRVGGGVGRADVTAVSYQQTRNEERLHCSVRVPLEGDEPVRLTLTARAAGTAREWTTTLDFDPGVGSGVPWYFAGFDWNIPDVGRSAGLLDATLDSLDVRVSLLQRPGSRAKPTVLHLIAGDGSGGELVLARRRLEVPAGPDTLHCRIRVSAEEIPFGLLDIKVRLTAGDKGFLAMVPERELTNLRLNWSDDALWRRHVGWLEGIAGWDARNDLDALRSPGERRGAWAQLWASRPPGSGPDEREHLLRIVEADRRFGEFGRGALSDRGRIFVRHGAPDRVESRVMDLSYPGEWEVWYYRRDGVLYRFYDAYGVGDYRLYDTAPF